jgi:glycyl-tRNA synthetase
MDSNNFVYHDVPDGQRAFYSKKTTDIEYKFPFGTKELWGCAHRGTHDLDMHIKESKKDLSYTESDGKKIIPEVIEPSVGCDRLFYALICDKYVIEKIGSESREVLKLSVELAPYKICVLPLTNKLNDKAYEIFTSFLKKGISCTYDTSGSIGKRYRRQDAIGTPYCVTYDFDSEKDKTVTVRERDTMIQKRVKISEVIDILKLN